MTAEGYYLVAHVSNAVSLETAEVELDVAAKSVDDEWFTNDGRQVWPFWTQPIEFAAPPIPDGWIEHLHQLARVHAAESHPTRDLISLLGLIHAPLARKAPIKRRL